MAESEPCERQKQLMLEAIRTAFDGVPRGNITMHQAMLIDSNGSQEEQAAARTKDTGKTGKNRCRPK